jgi:ankyrin repeat protein
MNSIFFGYAEIAKLIIEKDIDINAKDNDDITALWIVATNGNTEIVKLFLEKGADVNVKNKNGETALSAAKKLLNGILKRIQNQ